MNITEIVKNLVNKSGMDPDEINSGGCEDFAIDVFEFLNCTDETDLTYMRSDPFRECDEFGNKGYDWPAHFWIVHEGKHYDAECPYGVDCWHDLPIFKNWIERENLNLRREKISA